jgi:hypothetical protein
VFSQGKISYVSRPSVCSYVFIKNGSFILDLNENVIFFYI